MRLAPVLANLRESWGALRLVNNGPNGQEHSTMVQNGRVYPDHACVHEFLDFCNPYGVICEVYVHVCMSVYVYVGYVCDRRCV